MKKIFYTMAVAAALFAGYSSYDTQNSNELTGLALENVEALAINYIEKPNGGPTDKPIFGYNSLSGPCPSPFEYKRWKTCDGPILGGEEKECMNSDC